MNDRDTYDDDLRTLLRDAVADVHPEPALHRIRSRTATRPQHGSRTWLVGLAAAVTAAAIAGVVVVTTQRGPGSDSGPVASPPRARAPDPARPPRPPRSRRPNAPSASTTSATRRRVRGCTAEFHRLRVADGAAGAVGPAIAQALDRADDSDYRDLWPDGTRRRCEAPRAPS